MFLLYRSRFDVLKQAQSIREHLLCEPHDVKVPTCRIKRRIGRNRERVEMDVPLLGSIIFVRWEDQNIAGAQYLERRFPFIRIWRLPQGGYATCEEREIDEMSSLPLLAEELDYEEKNPEYEVDDQLQVKAGLFTGVFGTVLRVKRTGEVILKVDQSVKWRTSTLLIHSSLLAYRQSVPDKAASGDECLTPSAS